MTIFRVSFTVACWSVNECKDDWILPHLCCFVKVPTAEGTTFHQLPPDSITRKRCPLANSGVYFWKVHVRREKDTVLE